MNHTEDLDPQELEKPDTQDVEIATERLQSKNAPSINNLKFILVQIK